MVKGGVPPGKSADDVLDHERANMFLKWWNGHLNSELVAHVILEDHINNHANDIADVLFYLFKNPVPPSCG